MRVRVLPLGMRKPMMARIAIAEELGAGSSSGAVSSRGRPRDERNGAQE